MSSQIEEVCKIGQGNDCCRYLVVGPNGFECAKHTALKRYLDTRVTNKLITAQADNCEGVQNKVLN